MGNSRDARTSGVRGWGPGLKAAVTAMLPGQVLLVVVLLICGAAAAAPVPLAETPHFETTKFLIGLRQQGLFDLQTAYMEAYPPGSDAEKAWYERERKLAEAFAANVALEGRLDALKLADALAIKAIELESDSPRSVLWRIDRAQTWFYSACRPLFEQVLFYGRTASLKQNLKNTAGSAMAAYDEALASADAYLEQLSSPQGQSAAVQRLNLNVLSMLRQLQFERCWVQLYKTMALDRTDIDQGLSAGKIIRSLQDLHLLDGSDTQGGLGAQSLLMAAMASRLQSDWPAAEQYLQKTEQALKASRQVQGLEWVQFAAQAERGRLLLDQGQFAKAADTLDSLRRSIESDASLDATVKVARGLSLAMLQFEAMSLAADAAAAKGDQAAGKTYSTQRFEALAKLAGDAPDYRQSVYQMVADRMGEVAGVSGLPAFGKAVFAAKWLNQKKFDQALAAAELLDRETAGGRDYLSQDAIYFKAVCLQNLKQIVPAAEAYLRLAKDYPQDKRARQAAQTCMVLLSQDKAAIDSAAGRSVFVQAGELLLRSSPDLVKKQNWVLPMAEAALEEGRYGRAIELFQMVPRESPFYPYAMAGRIRAVSGKLRFAEPSQDQAKIRQEAEAAVAEAVALAKELAADKSPAASQPGQDHEALAGKVLLAASRLCVDPLGDPQRALDMLDGKETRWKEQPAMLAQLLSVRVQALQGKGDSSQAMQMVDRVVSVNPETAGVLIVSLLTQMQREIEQQQKLGRKADTEKQAALAVNLAERLDKWGDEHPGSLKPQQRYAIRSRLARTLLQAGQAERSLKLFDTLAQEDAKRSGGQAEDSTVLEGQADCLFALQRWAEARDAYQGIWRRAQVRSELWWRAILHSLQCSEKLNEDPDKILKVVRQHRNLYPDMGGPEMSKQFDELSFQMLKQMGTKKSEKPTTATK